MLAIKSEGRMKVEAKLNRNLQYIPEMPAHRLHFLSSKSFENLKPYLSLGSQSVALGFCHSHFPKFKIFNLKQQPSS